MNAGSDQRSALPYPRRRSQTQMAHFTFTFSLSLCQYVNYLASGTAASNLRHYRWHFDE